MARDRLAMILERMAAKKELNSSHYKVYLCLFSAIQEGKKLNKNMLSSIIGMSIRNVRRTTKELVETGNIKVNKDGFLSVTFVSGLPAKTDRSVRFQDKSGRATNKSLSMNLREDIRTKIEELSYVEHKTYKEILLSLNMKSSSFYSKSRRRKSDPRFKDLVEALFVTYEKEVKEKLNAMWGKSDAAMLKRLLKALPEETVERLRKSFENFLWTKDKFDADHIRKNPVRFWTTVVTEYLPSKDHFDVVENYRKKHGKVEKEKNV